MIDRLFYLSYTKEQERWQALKNEMDMKYAFFILFVLVFNRLCSAQKGNPFLNTEWRFIGLVWRDGSLHECPKGVTYIIEFKEHHKITGIATVNYTEKYRLKKNSRILIKLSISKRGDIQAPAGEFECRLDYGTYLGIGRTVNYKIEDNKLKVFSNEYITRLFERL